MACSVACSVRAAYLLVLAFAANCVTQRTERYQEMQMFLLDSFYAKIDIWEKMCFSELRDGEEESSAEEQSYFRRDDEMAGRQ